MSQTPNNHKSPLECLVFTLGLIEVAESLLLDIDVPDKQFRKIIDGYEKIAIKRYQEINEQNQAEDI